MSTRAQATSHDTGRNSIEALAAIQSLGRVSNIFPLLLRQFSHWRCFGCRNLPPEERFRGISPSHTFLEPARPALYDILKAGLQICRPDTPAASHGTRALPARLALTCLGIVSGLVFWALKTPAAEVLHRVRKLLKIMESRRHVWDSLFVLPR